VIPAIEPSREARRERVPFWALLAFYGVIAVLMADHVDDDAFIYFRTAANIATGHGYVFNAGGERIESGSSLVWQLLLALAYLLGFDLLRFAKVVGLLLGAATLHVLWRVSRHVIESRRLQIVPSLLLTVSIPFYGWVQRGLETSLYLFGIALVALFVVRPGLRRFWYAPTLLVALSRSEGFIVLAGLAAFFFFERNDLRQHVRRAGIVVATLATVVVARFLYFHDFVPHAFYVKIQELPGLPLRAALLYFTATGTWLLVAVGVLGLLERRAWSRDLIVLAVLNLPFLWWGFRTCTLVEYDRYLVPAFPLLYVLCIRGIDRLSLRGKWPARGLGAALVGFVGWLTVGAPTLSMSLFPAENLLAAAVAKFAANPSGFAARLVSLVLGREDAVPAGQQSPDGIASAWAYVLGNSIKKTYPPGTTIVFDQMGQTPWYSGLDKTFIDTLGLTYRPAGFAFYNHQIAASGSSTQKAYRALSERVLGTFWDVSSRRETNAEAVERIFALDPGVIIVNSFIDVKGDGVPSLVARDPRLSARYVKRNGAFMSIYEKKELASSRDGARREERSAPCQELERVLARVNAEARCAEDGSSKLVPMCNGVLGSTPRCERRVRELVTCVGARDADAWQCGPQGALEWKPTTCAAEQAAVLACVGP
jgi:hypothetical protein